MKKLALFFFINCFLVLLTGCSKEDDEEQIIENPNDFLIASIVKTDFSNGSKTKTAYYYNLNDYPINIKYFANDILKEEEIISYYETGKKKSYKKLNQDGDILTEEQYNENGDITIKETFDSEGDETAELRYENIYDTQNRLSVIKMRSSTNKLLEESRYVYRANGEIFITILDGAAKKTKEITENDKGQILNSKTFINGVISTEIRSSYDDKGNLYLQEVLTNSRVTSNYRYDITYDDKGNMFLKKIYSENVFIQENKFFYDKIGLLSLKESYSSKGIRIIELKYSWLKKQ